MVHGSFFQKISVRKYLDELQEQILTQFAVSCCRGRRVFGRFHSSYSWAYLRLPPPVASNRERCAYTFTIQDFKPFLSVSVSLSLYPLSKDPDAGMHINICIQIGDVNKSGAAAPRVKPCPSLGRRWMGTTPSAWPNRSKASLPFSGPAVAAQIRLESLQPSGRGRAAAGGGGHGQRGLPGPRLHPRHRAGTLW